MEECYIKCKESNIDKNTRDVKERVPSIEGLQHPLKSNYTSYVKGNAAFKQVENMVESFTPLNTLHERNWKEVFHLYDIPALSPTKEEVIGPEPEKWCKFHKVKGHHTKECYQLMKEIERLIQKGYIKEYVKGNPS